MKLPPIGTEVRIQWLDSTSEPGWQYAKSGSKFVAVPPRLMKTTAFLVDSSPVALAVAHTLCEASDIDSTHGCMDPLTIPLGCIVKFGRVP